MSRLCRRGNGRGVHVSDAEPVLRTTKTTPELMYPVSLVVTEASSCETEQVAILPGS